MTGALCLRAHLVAAAVVEEGLGSDDDWCALPAGSPCYCCSGGGRVRVRR